MGPFVSKRIMFAAGLAAIATASGAGGPAGNPLTIEFSLAGRLDNAFYALGDMGAWRRPDAGLETDLKAFMWDHRMFLNVAEVTDQHVVDAAICVLVDHYGFVDEFEIYADNTDFRNWCLDIAAGA